MVCIARPRAIFLKKKKKKEQIIIEWEKNRKPNPWSARHVSLSRLLYSARFSSASATKAQKTSRVVAARRAVAPIRPGSTPQSSCESPQPPFSWLRAAEGGSVSGQRRTSPNGVRPDRARTPRRIQIHCEARLHWTTDRAHRSKRRCSMPTLVPSSRRSICPPTWRTGLPSREHQRDPPLSISRCTLGDASIRAVRSRRPRGGYGWWPKHVVPHALHKRVH